MGSEPLYLPHSMLLRMHRRHCQSEVKCLLSHSTSMQGFDNSPSGACELQGRRSASVFFQRPANITHKCVGLYAAVTPDFVVLDCGMLCDNLFLAQS